MTEPAQATPVPSRGARPRWITWVARIALAFGGVVLGLVAAEAAFSYRDGGAFPHLNLYVADPALGVRLMPGATENIAFGGNPLTHVRINRDGYRGGELPPPGTDDVLVVGDSQVFGLGVEDDQTFAAVLASIIHRPVLNAGVPTYGPDEYRAVIAEQLAARHPKTVVLTINLVNDLFEVAHPNRERHAVWDGWAVRKETAPDATTSFPGRDFLYRRSHLFFALRKWRHAGDKPDNPDDKIDDRGVASEGTWRDAVATGTQVRKARSALEAEHRQRLAEVTQTRQQLEAAELAIDGEIEATLRDGNGARYDRTLVAARADPDDIVSPRMLVESARPVIATAHQIVNAAQVRAKLRAQLVQWAKTHETEDARAARAALASTDQALAKLAALDTAKLTALLDPPLGAHLRDVQRLVEGAGARLVVVILPIDVQVSADEWKKYGATPIDMQPSRALTDELVALCRALGVSVLDATSVLAAAEPGAFLDHDIHMTPKGHAAVAAALARTLAEAPPVARVASLRSTIPLPEVYKLAPELTVSGAREPTCEARRVREWLRVLCTRTGASWPTDLEITRDDGREALAMVMPGHVALLAPLVPGRPLVAKLSWFARTRLLRVTWPEGAAEPALAFDDPVERSGAVTPAPGVALPGTFRSETERAICDCWQAVFGKGSRLNGVFSCTGAYGAADPACVQRYYGSTPSCPELLACTRHDPSSPP